MDSKYNDYLVRQESRIQMIELDNNKDGQYPKEKT